MLVRDFYRADQEEEETIPSFAYRIEGLLSRIREKSPDQIPLQEEQRLLRDILFGVSRKNRRDNVKYCHAGPRMDYMSFLEECRKAEDEGSSN